MSGGDPVRALNRRLAALPGRLRGSVNAALQRIGDDTVAAARGLLAGADSAEPSAPGAPPRDSARQLAATLAVRLDETASTVGIASSSPHAMFLEYGTRSMAARPFLRPAIEMERPAALEACRVALAEAARSEGSDTR